MIRILIVALLTVTSFRMTHGIQKLKTSGVKVAKPSANYGKYEFKFTTLDGKKLKLSDYAGKAVLVNIWAPWCGPCKLETPGFVTLYKQYKDRGFEILSVAINTNENDVRTFIEKYGVQFPVGISDDVANQYGTYGIPDNYLFKPDGSLVKRFVGYTKEDVLRPLLEDALKTVAKSK
ncbi:MAG TPA: TlpA disulfide reductase family protein [Bacteroidota bacterium]|jgi:thiol-disulfide isomerase/thioredoxin|nr:TlpA disulfide reductase family protein [Bacteroidota bacterium]